LLLFYSTRTLLVLLFSFYSTVGFCQKKVEPTDHFTIRGLIEKPASISFSALEKEEQFEVDNLKILNHKGGEGIQEY
jgi:hypothetical protein